MSQGKVFIELKDIVKIFPGVRALDGVSLAEEAGEVRVTTEDRSDLIGQSFVLRAEDPSGVHAPLTMTVEVI